MTNKVADAKGRLWSVKIRFGVYWLRLIEGSKETAESSENESKETQRRIVERRNSTLQEEVKREKKEKGWAGWTVACRMAFLRFRRDGRTVLICMRVCASLSRHGAVCRGVWRTTQRLDKAGFHFGLRRS
jgi:hypothetical protein